MRMDVQTNENDKSHCINAIQRLLMWCGEGDLFFAGPFGISKLLILHFARRGRSGRNAYRGHILGTRSQPRTGQIHPVGLLRQRQMQSQRLPCDTTAPIQ